jgi:hypothetical protein
LVSITFASFPVPVRPSVCGTEYRHYDQDINADPFCIELAKSRLNGLFIGDVESHTVCVVAFACQRIHGFGKRVSRISLRITRAPSGKALCVGKAQSTRRARYQCRFPG